MSDLNNLIIPMAGSGRRFTEAGYGYKPLLPLRGKTMVEAVVDNLKGSPVVIHRMRDWPFPWTNLFLEDETQGAADTILRAEKLVGDGEIIVANCDQLVDIDIDEFLKYARQYDGCIMTFKSKDPKWSYARVTGDLVVEVAEKKPISPNATVGIYYFKSARQLFNGIRSMMKKNIRTNGEFYLCPVYNELIKKGLKISIYEIEKGQMHGLGTPEDYRAYLKKNTEAILFDLDGILVDAAEWHYEALNKALLEYGYQISREDHLTKYNGLPSRVKLDMLKIPRELHSAILDLKQQYTLQTINDYCRPDPEKIELLKALINNYKLGCVSNAVSESVLLMLSKSGLLPFFDIIVTNQDVKKNKPSPDCYLMAMEKLRVSPANTVIVEDSAPGIAAAKASGANVVETTYNKVNINLLEDYI